MQQQQQRCSVCPPKERTAQHATRPKRPASSLTGLAQRIALLESQQAWHMQDHPASSRPSPSSLHGQPNNALHAESDPSSRIGHLDEKLEAFAQRIKQALAAMQQQQMEEANAATNAWAEGAKSSAQAVRDLHERQTLLEARLASLMQDQALRMANTGNATSSSTSLLLPPGADARAVASAAAEAAATAAKQALAAAEAAELAAGAGRRDCESVLARQQRAHDEADARERRLHTRIEALSTALAEQGRAHAEAQRTLTQRIEALERTGEAHAQEMRELRLTLRDATMRTSVGARAKAG